MLSFKSYINQPRLLFSSLLRVCGFWIPDRWYLRMLYYLNTGRRLNLKNPQTFGEKIQWLKLYGRYPEYTMMVDKYAVKDYVANIIGKRYIIPTIGVWEKPEDINFDMLPQQFVLKATNGGGSGGVLISKNKSLEDKASVIKKMRKALKSDMYKAFREWPYKNIQPRIIAEPLIENSEYPGQDITDYKFYCFNGVPKYCQVIKGRHDHETIDFFNMKWEHQLFYGLNPVDGPKLCPADVKPIQPIHLDEMKKIAELLSKGITFSRIDLYDTFNGPLFGEITFYPASGLGVFTPDSYNIILGEMIKLPNL